MTELAISPDKLHELERFLYKEASFLDRPDLDKWIELYTDGACSGNPGPGGWAFILRDVRSGTERSCGQRH